MGIQTYDPTSVIVTVDNYVVTGFAPDTFVTAKWRDAGMRAVIGCEGEVTRSRSVDPAGSITLSLLQTADANHVLYAHWQDGQSRGTGIFTVQVKNLDATELHHGARAWVVKPPEFVNATDVKMRNWEIFVADMATDLAAYDRFGRLKSDLTNFARTLGNFISGVPL
jgi:hypothetical protein